MRIVLGLLIFAALSIAAPQSGKSEPSRKDSPARKSAERKQPADSRTGCIDQQDGHYVLVEPGNMKRIAALEADGFPQEGFAKYLGEKVTAVGRISTTDSGSVLKTRKVEVVSEHCSPAQN